jgi:hypothetical protein
MTSVIEPLLTRFATLRTGKAELPGCYDETRQVWVVQIANKTQPIIESEGHLKKITELVTKTDVQAEKDDPGYGGLLELTTKTAHQTEKDDVRASDTLFHLITATKVGGERPDI